MGVIYSLVYPVWSTFVGLAYTLSYVCRSLLDSTPFHVPPVTQPDTWRPQVNPKIRCPFLALVAAHHSAPPRLCDFIRFCRSLLPDTRTTVSMIVIGLGATVLQKGKGVRSLLRGDFLDLEKLEDIQYRGFPLAGTVFTRNFSQWQWFLESQQYTSDVSGVRVVSFHDLYTFSRHLWVSTEQPTRLHPVRMWELCALFVLAGGCVTSGEVHVTSLLRVLNQGTSIQDLQNVTTSKVSVLMDHLNYDTPITAPVPWYITLVARFVRSVATPVTPPPAPNAYTLRRMVAQQYRTPTIADKIMRRAHVAGAQNTLTERIISNDTLTEGVFADKTTSVTYLMFWGVYRPLVSILQMSGITYKPYDPRLVRLHIHTLFPYQSLNYKHSPTIIEAVEFMFNNLDLTDLVDPLPGSALPAHHEPRYRLYGTSECRRKACAPFATLAVDALGKFRVCELVLPCSDTTDKTQTSIISFEAASSYDEKTALLRFAMGVLLSTVHFTHLLHIHVECAFAYARSMNGHTSMDHPLRQLTMPLELDALPVIGRALYTLLPPTGGVANTLRDYRNRGAPYSYDELKHYVGDYENLFSRYCTRLAELQPASPEEMESAISTMFPASNHIVLHDFHAWWTFLFDTMQLVVHELYTSDEAASRDPAWAHLLHSYILPILLRNSPQSTRDWMVRLHFMKLKAAFVLAYQFMNTIRHTFHSSPLFGDIVKNIYILCPPSSMWSLVENCLLANRTSTIEYPFEISFSANNTSNPRVAAIMHDFYEKLPTVSTRMRHVLSHPRGISTSVHK